MKLDMNKDFETAYKPTLFFGLTARECAYAAAAFAARRRRKRQSDAPQFAAPRRQQAPAVGHGHMPESQAMQIHVHNHKITNKSIVKPNFCFSLPGFSALGKGKKSPSGLRSMPSRTDCNITKDFTASFVCLVVGNVDQTHVEAQVGIGTKRIRTLVAVCEGVRHDYFGGVAAAHI